MTGSGRHPPDVMATTKLRPRDRGCRASWLCIIRMAASRALGTVTSWLVRIHCGVEVAVERRVDGGVVGVPLVEDGVTEHRGRRLHVVLGQDGKQKPKRRREQSLETC